MELGQLQYWKRVYEIFEDMLKILHIEESLTMDFHSAYLVVGENSQDLRLYW